MNKIKLLPAIVLVLLNSCLTYYNPKTVDIPLIKGRGDMRMNTGLFISNDFHGSLLAGCNGTFSAGVTNVLAYQAHINLDMMSDLYLQNALGLYKRFENNTVVEMYGGYGYGTNTGDYSERKNNYHLAFTRLNAGKCNLGTANLDFGLGLQGGYLNGFFINNIPYADQNYQRKQGWLIEPSAFIRLGKSRVKYNMIVNYSWTSMGATAYQLHLPLSVGIGVNISLGKK